MSNSELKNPVFWAVICFFVGLGLAAWGWDKNESTIAARTHGAVTMIIVGCVLAAVGLIVFFAVGNKRQ